MLRRATRRLFVLLDARGSRRGACAQRNAMRRAEYVNMKSAVVHASPFAFGLRVFLAVAALPLTAACAIENANEEHDVAAEEASVGTKKSLADCIENAVRKKGSYGGSVTELDCSVAPQDCTTIPEPDLTPVASLGALRRLDLSGRCLKSLGPIPKLRNLERLALHHNDIADIRPLVSLSKLVALDMSDNPVRSTW
jgi:hypothetical protein